LRNRFQPRLVPLRLGWTCSALPRSPAVHCRGAGDHRGAGFPGLPRSEEAPSGARWASGTCRGGTACITDCGWWTMGEVRPGQRHDGAHTRTCGKRLMHKARATPHRLASTRVTAGHPQGRELQQQQRRQQQQEEGRHQRVLSGRRRPATPSRAVPEQPPGCRPRRGRRRRRSSSPPRA
jgi:hypothetical protein